MIKIESESAFSSNQKRLEFHKKLRGLNLAEGYSYDENKLRPRPYWPTKPVNNVMACRWTWKELKSVIQESGELVGLGHGQLNYDRRVIALTNPGLDDQYALTSTFFADFQLIRPGESTPSHRHTPCATRFIFEGKGWTTVGNENVDFSPGDIIFTGQFPWHDHGNSGQADLLFLDVLDIPLLQYLGVSLWEFDYETVTGTRDQHSSPYKIKNYNDVVERRSDARVCGNPRIRNTSDFNYLKWSTTKDLLLNMNSSEHSLYDGAMIEFTNSQTLKSVGPSMSIFSQMLTPGLKTLEHRHTSQTIYVGVEGCGIIWIDGQKFEWGPKDIVVVPSWSWHCHENINGSESSFLHSISDATLVAKLNLFREQQKTHSGEVVDSFWKSTYF